MRAQSDEPMVKRIGSEFRFLFCGNESSLNPLKFIFNMLQDPIFPAKDETPDGDSPRSADQSRNAPLTSRSRDEPSISEPPTQSKAIPEVIPPVSPPSGEQGGELPHLSPDTSAGVLSHRVVAKILSRIRRYSLRRFLFRCAEPILRPLRGYFLGDLFELTTAVNQRTVKMEKALRALILELTRRGDIAVLADDIRRQTGTLAEWGARLESQFAGANRLIEFLVNRNIVVLGDELLARTPYGYLLAPIEDLALTSLLAEGVPSEQATSRLLDLILQEGMTFVDVGAHLGIHTLHGASRVGRSGAVIAFEPTPRVFGLLQKTVRLNGIDDVCKCMDIALSSSEGLATFHTSDCYGHNSLYPLPAGEEKCELQVKTATLDNLLCEIQRLDVVKIDVEGAELDVLEGMRHLLANHRDIILIVEFGVPHLQRTGITPGEWFGRFFDFGFAPFALDERAVTWHRVAEREASHVGSTSVAFVRPDTKHWAVIKKHET
jgi:FkbM family methyltransferase